MSDRRGFLGSSDIAAVLGVSPWKTPLQLWLEKTGREVPEVDEQKAKLFRRGKRLESVILDMLAEERGLSIIARNQRYSYPGYLWMVAEIDAEIEDPTGLAHPNVNVEVKTAHQFTAHKWGEQDTDEIPIEYAAQAAWGQMVTGRSRTIFAVLIGADNLVTYELKRDNETIAAMREKAIRFWHDHVLADVPPEPHTQQDLSYLFRRDASTRIEASEELAAQALQYLQLGVDIQQLSQARDELKFKIGCAMLGGEIIEAPEQTATHVLTWGGRSLLQVAYRTADKLDGKALEKDHPELAAQYRYTSKYFEYRKAQRAK